MRKYADVFERMSRGCPAAQQRRSSMLAEQFDNIDHVAPIVAASKPRTRRDVAMSHGGPAWLQTSTFGKKA